MNAILLRVLDMGVFALSCRDFLVLPVFGDVYSCRGMWL